MRRTLLLLAAAALAAVVVIGLTQAGGSTEPTGTFDLAKAKQELAGAPAPLAKLHDESNQLLDGGSSAFNARLTSLRGHPVVINKWASWCGPCRAELPILQVVSTQQGKRVAFVGLNAKDKHGSAERFAAKYPVPYPSYEDPGEKIARSIKAPANFPVTLFLDKDGKTVFIHQGGYPSAAKLNADIEKYLSS
jgi:cytochrome c biogenesis protein CcmG/thiol:disulfide interchange protein DsbE